MSTQVEDPKVFGSSFSHFIFVSFFYFLFFYGLIFSSWRLRAEKGKREREREEKRIKWNLMAGAWRGANAIPRPGRMTWWIQDTQRETKKEVAARARPIDFQIGNRRRLHRVLCAAPATVESLSGVLMQRDNLRSRQRRRRRRKRLEVSNFYQVCPFWLDYYTEEATQDFTCTCLH